MHIYPTFAEALRMIMAAHKWTAEELAGMVGYRSKTSIVRIMQEKSSQINRQQFFDKLIAAGNLEDDETALLRNALNTSRLGRDQACARGIIYDIIRGSSFNDSDMAPNMEIALNLLESCTQARIVMVNCMWPQVADRFGSLLSVHPGLQLEHIFVTHDSSTSAATALVCTSRMSCLPNYQGYSMDGYVGSSTLLTGANIICAEAITEQGKQINILVVMSSLSNVHLRTEAAQHGMFAFWQRVIAEAAQDCRSVTCKCDTSSGPESFVSTLRVMRDCERHRDTYQITPDFCVNMLPTNCLRASLTDGLLREAFSHADKPIIERLVNEFIACQRQRYEYMFNSRNAKHLILSTSAVRRFAETGTISSHFQAMRPFTLRERLEVLRNIFDHALRNPYFHLYFFKGNFCPAYEIVCWEQHSMACMPVNLNRSSAITDNYCCNMINHPKLLKVFISCFKDEIRPRHTLSRVQTLEFLRSTIVSLER